MNGTYYQVVLLFPQQSKSGAYFHSFLDSLGGGGSAQGFVMHFYLLQRTFIHSLTFKRTVGSLLL